MIDVVESEHDASFNKGSNWREGDQSKKQVGNK